MAHTSIRRAKKWDEMNAEGLSYKEIADKEGVTKGVVAGAVWRHVRAKDKYRAYNNIFKPTKDETIEELLGALELAQEGLGCIMRDMDRVLNEGLEDPELEQSVLNNCISDLEVTDPIVKKARGESCL